MNTICNCCNYSFFRCLAHIINLATQTLISTRSKAKYYSADAEDDHIPDLDAFERDEVGLVRAVTVKVSAYLFLDMSAVFSLCFFQARSSAQRKELFKTIQSRAGKSPKQLLLDMKVRWGSTYVMLTRAETLKKVSFHEFVDLQ